MAFEVTFQDAEVKAMLKDLSRKMDDFKEKRRPIVGLMAARVFADVMEHFSDERGPTSDWQDWSDKYDIAMAKRGKSGNKILQDTGRLRQNFKPASYRDVSGGVLWYNNAKTKSGAPYAYYHNEGIGSQPQREFMWLSPKALGKLEDDLLNYMLESKT
jgi:phage gpG-like protein